MFWLVPFNTSGNQDERALQMHLVNMLRKHSSDEMKFQRFLCQLEQAIALGKPFDSLDGAVVSKGTLARCLTELRTICEFPIRPDDEPCRSGQTQFGQAVEKFAKSDDATDPNLLNFVILYTQLSVNQHMTLIKVGFWGVGVCLYAFVCVWTTCFLV